MDHFYGKYVGKQLITTLGKFKEKSLVLMVMLCIYSATHSNAVVANTTEKHSLGSDFSIQKYTIDSGAGRSMSTDFKLTGTIAQVDTEVIQSDDYVINGGFWWPDNDLTTDVIFANGFE